MGADAKLELEEPAVEGWLTPHSTAAEGIWATSIKLRG